MFLGNRSWVMATCLLMILLFGPESEISYFEIYCAQDIYYLGSTSTIMRWTQHDMDMVTHSLTYIIFIHFDENWILILILFENFAINRLIWIRVLLWIKRVGARVIWLEQETSTPRIRECRYYSHFQSRCSNNPYITVRSIFIDISDTFRQLFYDNGNSIWDLVVEIKSIIIR